MNIIGSAYVNIKAITDKLEEDIKNSLAGIADTLNVHVSADTSQAKTQIDDIIDTFSGVEEIVIDVDADTSKVVAKIEDFANDIHEGIIIDVDVDTTEAESKLEGFINEPLQQLAIEANVDFTDARKAIEVFATEEEHETIGLDVEAETAPARASLLGLLAEFMRSKVNIRAIAETAAARIDLAALAAKTYYVDFRANFDEKSFKDGASKAGRAVSPLVNYLNQLSGMQVFLGMSQHLIEFKRNIGVLTPGIVILTEKIGLMSIGITAAVGSVLSLGSSLTDLLGVGWALPGILAGIGIAAATSVVGLKDLNNQVPEIRNQFKLMAAEIRGDFWSEAREGFQDFAGSLPEFRKQLSGTSKALGSFWGALAAAVDSDDNLAWTVGMFDSLAESIRIGERAAKPFVDSVMNLGVVGSAYLPRLATWMVKLVEQFEQFTTVNLMNGNLDKWIERGIDGFKDLGGIIKNTTSIFSGLAKAATDAGGPTLDSFNTKLENIAKTVNGEPFKTTLTTIFRGAFDGASAFSKGLEDLGWALVDLAPTIETSFVKIGEIAAKGMELISIALTQPKVAEGIQSFFDGVLRGVEALEPAMGPIGDKFGVFADFVGELAAQLGPVLATAATELLPILTELFENIKPLIKPLSDLTIVFIKELSPAISAIATEVIPPLVTILKDDLIPLFKDVAEVVGPALKLAVEGIGNAFDEIKPKVEGSATHAETAKGVWQSFVDLLNTPMGQGSASGKTLGEGIEETFKGVQEAIDNFDSLDSSNKFWEDRLKEWGWKEAVDKWSADADRDIEQLDKDVNQALSDFAGDTGRNTEGMFKDIGTSLDQAGKDISTSWNSFWDDMGSGADGLNEDVNSALDSFWTDTRTNFSNWATDVETDFTNFTTDVSTNWTNFWTDVDNNTKPFRDGAAEAFDKVQKAGDKLFGEPMRAWADANNQHWQEVGEDIATWATDTGDDIATWWEKTNEDNRIAQQKQKEDNDKFWADVNAGWDGMWSDINTRSDEFWGPFNEKAAQNWQSFTGGLQGMSEDMGAGWDGMWADTNRRSDEFWGPFNERQAGNWATFTGGLQGMASDIGAGWDGMWADTNRRSDEFWGPFNENVSTQWSNFTGGLQGMATDAGNGWNGMWADMESNRATWGGTIAGNFANFTSSLGQGWQRGMTVLDDIGRRGWGAIAEFVGSAWNNIGSAVQRGIDTVVDFMRNLPQNALNALGDLGGWLRSSGEALINGFLGGIEDAAAGLGNTVSGILSGIRDMFPFSPAKKGPFSGLGYTTHSGKALVKDFAAGMRSELVAVEAAALSITQAANPASLLPKLGSASLALGYATPSIPSLTTQAESFYQQAQAVPVVTKEVVAPVVNVYPPAQLDSNQVGRMAATELYWQLLNG